MLIDVKKFAADVEEALAAEGCHWEIKMYAPGMLQEIERSFSRSSTILMGQRILMHHFGEILAARFKKWIDANYEIGSDDRQWGGPSEENLMERYESQMPSLGSRCADGRRAAA